MCKYKNNDSDYILSLLKIITLSPISFLIENAIPLFSSSDSDHDFTEYSGIPIYPRM